MSAPRLLDKKVINADLAVQKKRSIDEGLTLARKVDALRETLQTEQGNLEKFREKSIANVQREIDMKISERTVLEQTNATLREERIRLLAPVDLSQAWAEVKTEKVNVSEWRTRLSQEQMELLAEKGDVSALSEKLKKLESNIERRDILSERTLIEAESKFNESSQLLENTIENTDKQKLELKNKEKELAIREQEIAQWNDSLVNLENNLKEKDQDLKNRERALTDKYETFMRAQNYIANKKK